MEWGGATAGLSTGLAFTTSKESFQKALVDLLNNSESGKDFARYGGDLHTSLTDAQLRLPAGPLSDAVDEMNTLMLRWWDDVITPMSEDLKREQPNVDRRMQMATRYTEAWTSMIRVLEATARSELPRITRVSVSERRRVH